MNGLLERSDGHGDDQRDGPRRGRLALLASSALIAIAAGASVAHGQAAFQGRPTYTSGNVSYSSPDANTDVFTVGTASTIIDWTPTQNSGSGTIGFLPAGKTGIFQSTTSPDFTVLNRVNPADASRPIQFDGTVLGRYVNASGASSPGGAIFFYTPGGIILGATARFDVGSLILTTNAIDTSNGLPQPGQTLSFRGTSGSTSAIGIAPGAQIQAANPGSYVALVAPRIAQGGTVTVNGSVGYIAAEAADVTINAGLFTIANTIGSQVAAGGETTLTHTGTTTGAAATATGSPHAIYMVAIPKNDAVTMLVSGNVGYQAASDASVVNGRIVLGAGYAFDGTLASGGAGSAPTGGPASAVVFTDGSFTSGVYAYSNGSVAADTRQASDPTHGDLDFAAGLVAYADRNAALAVTSGQRIDASSILISSLGGANQSAGLPITISVQTGGTLAVGGTLQASSVAAIAGANTGAMTMSVSGSATVGGLLLDSNNTTNLTSATAGGATTLTVDGGSLTVTGDASLSAEGNTGGTSHLVVTNNGKAAFGSIALQADGSADPASLFPGTGGTASISVSAGGALTTAGLLAAHANGSNGSAPPATGTPTTAGGAATVTVDHGTITVTGTQSALIEALAYGTGSARSGTASLTILNGGTFTDAAGLDVWTFALNGAGATAAAQGGGSSIGADGADSLLSVAGPTYLDADASGSAATGAGFDAQGGTATIAGSNGAKIALGTLQASGGANAAQGATGSARGGVASVLAGSGSTISVAGVTLSANAAASSVATDAGVLSQGGRAILSADGGDIGSADSTAGVTLSATAIGGTATGGTARVAVDGGGAITMPASLSLSVNANGGSAPSANGVDSAGYIATGGLAEVAAANGALNLGSMSLSSYATGGGGAGALEGGNALGGTTRITTTGSNGRIVAAGDVDLNSDGFTSSSSGKGAADGTGGTTEVIARGGSIQFGGSLSMIPDGQGAYALTAGRDLATQGIGQGGTVRLIADDNGSIAITGFAYLSPYGDGGGATIGVSSATGLGGTVTVATGAIDGQPGTITFGTMDLDAGAFGGGGGSVGGAAVAPHTTVTVGAGGQITGSDLTIENYAHAGVGSGAGAVGGTASGGTVAFDVTGGTVTIADAVTITAVNVGGAGLGGGAGGAATGGGGAISIASGSAGGGAWGLTVGASGGAGGAGDGGAGGTGGSAAGGVASLSVSGGSLTPAALTVTSTNTGGAGGAGAGFTDDPANPTPVQNGFAGGAGGSASGGAATVLASGGVLTTGGLTLASVSGGGAGGIGGDGAGYSATTGAATGGAGGAGGASAGGLATLSATGGAIGAGTTSVTASGTASTGGTGGSGGTDPTAGPARAAAGAGGAGASDGGAVTLATSDAGMLTLGDTTLDASGAVGTTGLAGTISIMTGAASGAAPAPAISLASLSSTNSGFSAGMATQLVQAAAPIAVTGAATFNGATGVTYAIAPTGGLTAGGALNVTVDHVATSGGGTITAATIGIVTTGAADTSGIALAATGGPIDLTAGTALATGDLSATGGIALAATTGALRFGTLSAGDDISAQAAGAISGTAQTSTHGSIADTAGASADIARLSAGDGISIVTGGTGHFATLAAGTDPSGATTVTTGDFGLIGVRTIADLTIDGAVTAAGSIGLLSAGGAIAAPTLTAGSGGSVAVLGGGAITLGAVSAPGLFYVGGPAAIASLSDGSSVAQVIQTLRSAGAVASGGAVVLSGIQAGSATIAAGTTLDIAGAVQTGSGDAILMAAGDLHTGDLTSTGGIGAMSGTGSLTLGNLVAGTDAGGGGIILAGATGVTAGNLTGVNSVSARSTGGAVSLRTVASTGGSVHVTAAGAISMLNVAAAGSIDLTGGAAITAGDLTAGTGALRPGEGGSGGGTDPSAGGIAPGFADGTVDRCDDCYTSSIALPFTINYFGTRYATTYVSNNGYLTFNSGQSEYTPAGLGTGYTGQPIVAPFFADVDTSNPASGTVTYGNGSFAGRQAFATTWNGVGYYGSHVDKLNTFQVVLTNRADTGSGNFDIYYNYAAMNWETGDADGGVGGLGGNAAAVGYNAGTGNQAGTYYELAGSRVAGTFINGGTAPLILTTNDGIPGQLRFSVRNGQVTVGGASEPATIRVTNVAAGNTAAIQLGTLSAEAAEVHGAGRVQVGAVTIGDKGSGATAPGNPHATVLDAANGLSVQGDISSTGLVALGGGRGDVSTQAIDTASSAIVLANGAVALGQVTTGQAATDSLFISEAAALAGGSTGFDFTTLLSGTTFDPATLTRSAPSGIGGPLTIAGPVTTGTLLAASAGAATLGQVTAAGPVSIESGGALAAGDISAGGGITLASGGAAMFGRINAGGPLSIDSAGPIAAGNLSAGGDLTLTAAGDATLGLIASSGGQVSATSRTGALSVGGAQAANAVTLTSAGLLTIGGAVDATSIGLTSADIAVADQTPIGSARTTAVTYTNKGAGRLLIGVGGTSGDYRLSAAALANTHAGTITINQTAAPDVVIGGVALVGSAGESPNLIGDQGALAIVAPGSIQLIGLLSVGGAGAGNIVSLTAGRAITGVLPAAGLSLADASGALAGSLSLAADRIEFDTPATAAAVAGATTLGARSDSLGLGDGATGNQGYIRANAVRFTVGSALYTQNSGAAGGTDAATTADRAGVTAGAGGLTVATTGTAPIDLVLNGTIVGASGTSTGADVIKLVNGGVGTVAYAPQSSINGCLADGSPCGGPVGPTAAVISAVAQMATPPIQDVVQVVSLSNDVDVAAVGNAARAGLGQSTSYTFQSSRLVSFEGLAPDGLAPLIDVPVTGAGNDNLWVGVGVAPDQPRGRTDAAGKPARPPAR